MADAPVVDLLEGTRTILRALQGRLAREIAAGKTIPKGEQRQLVELTERVERLRAKGEVEPVGKAVAPEADGLDSRYCNAVTRAGGNCRRPAGWGTGHAGVGRCVKHAGKTPTHETHGRRELLVREVRRTLGVPLDVDPATAILDAVREAAGNVALLRERVADERNTEALIDYQGKPHTNPVLAFYNEERDRLARFAKLASDMKIDEVRVRLAESQGRALAEVVEVAVAACNPTDDERAAAVRAAGERMRELGASAFG